MSLEFWRNVSVIWIAIHAFVLFLIPTVIAYFVVRGINWLLAKTKLGFEKAQGFSRLVNARTETISQRVAAPVIATHSKMARVERIGKSFFGNGK
ncbi:MAG: hypothetical protein KF753_11360 [Caldilineaceae bacterium]|nr:hypothetical protein [Caldilineaceae bacterium]